MNAQRLLLVQHAQSEHHVNGLTGGWTDTPLTALGRSQADALARRLADELAGVAVYVYSSDLKRAAETADVIAAALHTEIRLAPALREHNGGAATGLTVAAAERIWRPWPADCDAKMNHHPYDGAETPAEHYRRVAMFLDLLPLDRLCVLVSHGGTVRHAIKHFLGLGAHDRAGIDFASSPGSVTWLTTRYGQRVVAALNDTSHLVGPGPARRLDIS